MLSSPSLRCIQTVEPLARSRGLAVEEDPRLGEGAGARAALRLLDGIAPHPSALCSHGDVIGELILHLLDSGMTIDGGPRWAKGSVWVLDGDGGAIRRGRYLPPSA